MDADDDRPEYVPPRIDTIEGIPAAGAALDVFESGTAA